MGTILRMLSIGMLLVAGPGGLSSAQAYDCGQKYCKQMSSCGEAHFKFTVCGRSGLDRDNDGVPCENVCGKTLEIYYGRLQAEGIPPDQPMKRGDIQDGPTWPPPNAVPTVELKCAGKRRCGEMLSCEEARFYLTTCGVRSLDGDGNGVPCESLCRGR